MTRCPHCGGDLTAPKRLVATSARDLVESLRLEGDLFQWCAEFCEKYGSSWSAAWIAEELEMFKDRMRANGYRTNAGPVKDAAAAFRTHLRNAVKYASQRGAPSKTTAPVARVRKEL